MALEHTLRVARELAEDMEEEEEEGNGGLPA